MRSVWYDTHDTHETTGTEMLPGFPRLERDIKTDVLVIGGGLAGLLTAYFLKQNGVSCVVAEGRRICGGTTGFTTAKITFQHGLIYDKLIRTMGTEKALMYLNANRRALERYREMCADGGFDFEEKDNYVYSLDDRAALEREAAALERLGAFAQFRGELPLPFKTAGGVRVPAQAQFNPLKFAAHIAKGLDIYENTHIIEMRGNTAVSDRAKISAESVVAATHYPFINKHGAYFLKLYQHRSYVAALENAPDVGGMYVDEDKTGMSFRNYGGLLLIGGGGHRTGKPGGSECGGGLAAFAKRHYPDARVKYRWAAQDCMSLDGVPYIGRYSSATPRFYVASGFNKWGMTSSMAAAEILCDMIMGRKNEYAEVFDPSRSIFHPQLAVNGLEAAAGLLTPSSKRCPHMGCALKWNKAERSWDCSCHGSRFARDGRVLDNPANGGLK